jgi:hypothetical protein
MARDDNDSDILDSAFITCPYSETGDRSPSRQESMPETSAGVNGYFFHCHGANAWRATAFVLTAPAEFV